MSQGKGRKQELGEEREKHRAEEMCPPAMQEETRTGQRWGFLWPVPSPTPLSWETPASPLLAPWVQMIPEDLQNLCTNTFTA